MYGECSSSVWKSFHLLFCRLADTFIRDARWIPMYEVVSAYGQIANAANQTRSRGLNTQPTTLSRCSGGSDKIFGENLFVSTFNKLSISNRASYLTFNVGIIATNKVHPIFFSKVYIYISFSWVLLSATQPYTPVDHHNQRFLLIYAGFSTIHRQIIDQSNYVRRVPGLHVIFVQVFVIVGF